MKRKINNYNYTINSSGEIFSIRSNKKIKPYISAGYYKVDLYKNAKRRKVFVHQLMCETFMIKSIGAQCINHIDGNKLNNSLNNLEWCTYSENLNHSYVFLKRKSANHKKLGESILAKKILKVSLDGVILNEYGSIVEAIKEYGTGVEKCLYRKRKTAYGYKWIYKV